MTHWQEPPQSSPLCFEQPSFAYTWPPHIEVSASPLLHKQPPQNVWPPLPAPSLPMHHIVPVMVQTPFLPFPSLTPPNPIHSPSDSSVPTLKHTHTTMLSPLSD